MTKRWVHIISVITVFLIFRGPEAGTSLCQQSILLANHSIPISDMASNINPSNPGEERTDTVLTHGYDEDISHHGIAPSLMNSNEDRAEDPGEVERASFMHEHMEGRYNAEDSERADVEADESHHREMHHPSNGGAGDEELAKKHNGDERFEVDDGWGRPTHHSEKESNNDHMESEVANDTNSIVGDSSNGHRRHHGQNEYERQQPHPEDLSGPGKNEHLPIGYHGGIDGEETTVPALRESRDDLSRVSGAFDRSPTTSSYFHHPKDGGGGSGEPGPDPESGGMESGTDSGTSGSKRRVLHGNDEEKDDEAGDGEGKTKKREREQRQEYYQGLVNNGFRVISNCFITANRSIRGIETDQRNMLESENEIGEELVKFGVRVREATQVMQAQIFAAFTGDARESAPTGVQSEQPPDNGDNGHAGGSRTTGIPRNSENIRRVGAQPNVGAKENTDRPEWGFGRQDAEGIQSGSYHSHPSRNETTDQESSREERMTSFSKSIDSISPQEVDDRDERQGFRDRRPLHEVARGEPNDTGRAGGNETALKRPRWNSSLRASAGTSNARSVPAHQTENEDAPPSFLLHREQQSFLSGVQNEADGRWGRE